MVNDPVVSLHDETDLKKTFICKIQAAQETRSSFSYPLCLVFLILYFFLSFVSWLDCEIVTWSWFFSPSNLKNYVHYRLTEINDVNWYVSISYFTNKIFVRTLNSQNILLIFVSLTIFLPMRWNFDLNIIHTLAHE